MRFLRFLGRWFFDAIRARGPTEAIVFWVSIIGAAIVVRRPAWGPTLTEWQSNLGLVALVAIAAARLLIAPFWMVETAEDDRRKARRELRDRTAPRTESMIYRHDLVSGAKRAAGLRVRVRNTSATPLNDVKVRITVLYPDGTNLSELDLAKAPFVLTPDEPMTFALLQHWLSPGDGHFAFGEPQVQAEKRLLGRYVVAVRVYCRECAMTEIVIAIDYDKELSHQDVTEAYRAFFPLGEQAGDVTQIVPEPPKYRGRRFVNTWMDR